MVDHSSNSESPKPEGDRSLSPQKENFFFPRSRYYGEFTPQQLAFNANLQEFAQRVAFICSLETGGKLPSLDAYKQIKDLWKDLKRSKNELLDRPNPTDVDLPPEE
ncbi:MAG: hypothetical protein WBA57_01985 [Elainellaceae cyanobacterium]